MFLTISEKLNEPEVFQSDELYNTLSNILTYIVRENVACINLLIEVTGSTNRFLGILNELLKIDDVNQIKIHFRFIDIIDIRFTDFLYFDMYFLVLK